MSQSYEKLTTVLCISVILLHATEAPYTKVEESFNIQAAHDILKSGVSFAGGDQRKQFIADNYDHVAFPGAVPRTFVGALLLALVTGATQVVAKIDDGVDLQALVRGLLGLINGAALIAFRNAVSRSFGTSAAVWYMLLQTSQFHVMYYASRTLPNMFAFALTTWAFRDFIYGISAADQSIARAWYRQSLFYFTFAGVVFRAELAVLVAALSAFLLRVNRSLLTSTIIPAGLVGALFGLSMTVIIDSYFWQQFPSWPEFQGFWYNTILGKASDWGVSPWHYYFSSAIPRLLLNPLTYSLLILTAISAPATRSRSLALLLPSLAFVAIYSFLPHKEWRFVIYIIPPLTATASLGASWIWTRRSKSLLYRSLSLGLIASVLASYAASAGLLFISKLNYPGGVAVQRLHALDDPLQTITHVYADNLACQTGLTRFLEDHMDNSTQWMFDKTEDAAKLLSPEFWEKFDYAIVEQPQRAIGKFQVVDLVRGYGGVRLVRPGMMLDSRSLEARVLNGRVVELEGWESWWLRLGESFRDKYTRGWWATIAMDPKLWILKKQRTGINTAVEEA